MTRARPAFLLALPLLLAFVPAPARGESPQGAAPQAIAGEEAPARPDTIDSVVVTATRVPTAARRVGSSVTVITRREIEARPGAPLTELLRGVPGLDLVQNGSEGQTATLLIRGAKSEHTLVLIDGVPANDPTSPSGTFDFSALSPDNIERIEVLRGPQSPLYGSDAIGGVVSIITRRGKGEPRGRLFLEGGSFGAQKAELSLTGSGGVDYSLDLGGKASEGISDAAASAGNTEKDGFSNLTLSARLAKGGEKEDGWDLALRVAREKASLDEWNPLTFIFSDDPNSTSTVTEAFLRAKVRVAGGYALQSGGISLSDYRRAYRNPPDSLNPDAASADYRGGRVMGDWQAVFDLGDHSLTAGVEAGVERARSDYRSVFFGGESVPGESASNAALFLEDRYDAGGALSAAVGGRVDRHSRFGTAATYRVAPSWEAAPGLRLKGSYGTGFSAPTLYQLFSPLYGNAGLSAEKSRGWDAGAEVALGDGAVSLSLTWFGNRFTDLIDFVVTDPLTFAGEYRNVARAESSGSEMGVSAGLGGGLSLAGTATRTRTRDLATGAELLRRPREKWSASLSWEGPGGGKAVLDSLWVGKRLDTIGFSVGELPGYSLLALSTEWPLGAGWRVTARVENLLDREYQEVAGYGTPGRSFALGVKAEL